MIEVTEVSIAELRAALESGRTTAVELVKAYLARIDAYDGPDTPTRLNAVVVRNPDALKEAEASDARRARGETLGPLDGIPYTAKDSYTPPVEVSEDDSLQQLDQLDQDNLEQLRQRMQELREQMEASGTPPEETPADQPMESD